MPCENGRRRTRDKRREKRRREECEFRSYLPEDRGRFLRWAYGRGKEARRDSGVPGVSRKVLTVNSFPGDVRLESASEGLLPFLPSLCPVSLPRPLPLPAGSYIRISLQPLFFDLSKIEIISYSSSQHVPG